MRGIVPNGVIARRHCRWLFIVGALLAIALGTTDVALALQSAFGPRALLAAIGTLLAALGGIAAAVVLRER